MDLIIAEKKNVAKFFSKVLKDNFKTKNGYFEGEKYVITWGYGHLVNSKQPVDYEEFGGWNWESIPFYPPNHTLDYIKPDKTDFDKVRATQLKNIKEAYKNNSITTVINACDAEREGELIFWEIYEFLKMNKPVKRLWLQSQEESDALKAFNDLKEETFYSPKRDASYARQYADYVLGHNLTVAFTEKVKSTLHIGRVQTPTLSLLVKRRLERDNFVSENYFELDVEFGDKYIGKWYKTQKGNTKLDNLDKVKEIEEKIKGKIGKVIEKEVKKTTESPKKLFNLGDLQKEANAKFGHTAKKTLDLAQQLYDKYNLISYPRTSSAYLMDTQVSSFKNILDSLSIPEYKNFTEDIIKRGIPTNKSFVDNSKVSDHFAIIPTKKKVNWSELKDDPKENLKAEELKKLYDLIVRRFLSVFYPAAEYEKTEIVTEVNRETFKTNGRILVNEGWRRIYGKENKGNESEESKDLPPIAKEEENVVSKIDQVKKQTKPKAHYNDSTIISAMEKAKEYIEEDEIKENIKETDAGMELGTVATRDSIIENIISRKYAERKGKQIIATDLGVKLIEIAPNNLKSPEVTAVWEIKLKKMENGDYDQMQFHQEIEEFVAKEIEEVKNKEITVTFPQKNNSKFEKVGVCPKCGEDILDFGKGVACSTSTREKGCYKIWGTVASKKLSKTNMKDLVVKGKTKLIKGFKKSDGSGTFDAILKVNDDYLGVGFEFPEQETIIECPKCGKDIKNRGKYFSCGTNTREEPCVSGPTEYAGKKLTKKEIIDLVIKGETEYLDFISSKKNKYEAKLTLKQNEFKMVFKPRETKKTNINCPECDTVVALSGNRYKCKTNNCDFVVFKEMSKKPITEEIIKEVLDNEVAGPYTGFTSKEGKAFKAKLRYNKEKKKIEFDF